MQLPKKPLSDAELEAFEAGRDIEADLTMSARQMAAGSTHAVYTPVVAARQQTGLSQDGFATLLGVSKRTLPQWEQGRREPTGAAKTLVAIALKAPEAFKVLDLNCKPLKARADAEQAVALMKSAVAATNNAFEAVQAAVRKGNAARFGEITVDSAPTKHGRSASHHRRPA